MKFRSLKAAFVCVVLSSNVNANIITYGSYSYDTDTSVVVGDGLEWLKWSLTNNMSYTQAINYANSNYGDGWGIATSDQVSGLVQNFDFGFSWDPQNPSEVTGSSVSAGSRDNNNYQYASYYNFVSMFGHTYSGSEGNQYANWNRLGSRAIFGPIDTSTNTANLLSVWSLRNISYFNCCNFKDTATITLNENYLSRFNYYRNSIGVALTRVSTAPSPILTVSAPSTLAIFALGLIGLASRRFNKQ
jgi:hypothetical protein